MDHSSGAAQEDGYVFRAYQPAIRKSDGYFLERWMGPDAKQKEKARQKEYDHKRERERKHGKKRVNPQTNKPYVSGDIQDGLVFYHYRLETLDQKGFFTEDWLSPEKYSAKKRQKLRAAKERLSNWSDYIAARLTSLEIRAKKKKLSFNLDVEYLMKIYPADGLCPVLGFPMDHMDMQRGNSPSVDRVDNTLGYIKGNVAWMSMRANTIKSDSSLSELQSLVNFIEDFQEINRKN